MKTEKLSMGPETPIRPAAGTCGGEGSAWAPDGADTPGEGASPNSRAPASWPEVSERGRAVLEATILLISDDRYFRTTVRAYLEHLGFRVHSCGDAMRVPELFFRGGGVNLLLIDVQALGGPGLRLAAELNAFRPGLPVIVLTAPHVETSVFKGLAGKNWAFLQQPAALPEIREAIGKAMVPQAESRFGQAVSNSTRPAASEASTTGQMREPFRAHSAAGSGVTAALSHGARIFAMTSRKGIRILSICDDDGIRVSRELVLKHEGYEVKSMTSQDEAHAEEFHVVILCHSLTSDGAEAITHRLRAANPSIRILRVHSIRSRRESFYDLDCEVLSGPAAMLSAIRSLVTRAGNGVHAHRIA